MSYLLEDLGGLVGATLLAPVLLCCAGFGLLRLLERRGLAATEGVWPRAGWAMILSLAILPVMDALAIRAIGMPGMLLLNGALALFGIRQLRGIASACRGAGVFLLIALGWWLICAWTLVDFDHDGRLYQSLVVFDMVKHAAVVEQIARQGIPFTDPFFARDGIAGYYHYFYVWPAAIRWVSGFHISPVMAFAACAYWTGIAVVALLWRIAADASLIRKGCGRRALMLAILLCFVAGADLLFMALRYLMVGRIEPEIENWNSEIRMLATSTIWVPHHIMALVAGWTGLLLNARARRVESPQRLWLAGAAGAAYASMFGASVWISLTIAPVLIVWGVMMLWRRDGTLLLSGVVALLLSVPQSIDLLHGRAPDIFPVALHVRPFTLLFASHDMAAQLWSLILLPLNYALEFGFVMLGAGLYARSVRPTDEAGRPVRRLLVATLVAGLLVASFLRSVIINNDLGWRAALFILVPLMIWTMRVAQEDDALRRFGVPGALLLALGLAGTAWDIVGLRVIRAPAFPVRAIEVNDDPAMAYALRDAYRWADRHLPEGATLQHNPVLKHRALDFGLYTRHWPAVADRDAFLFGADRHAVAARVALLAPIFIRPLTPAQYRDRAARGRSDTLLFTRRDPVWKKLGGPPLALPCLYRTSDICIASPTGKTLPGKTLP
ncbi:hypothetical protein [Sphingobium lactosutens]|uniref:Glycosyltransferase RgtA/B/C/D-like domain-containing protein n=1 Tax=Sphingobium lactosutens DS20 TaxID=1331060 RepID=T0HX47_9SPHN|nr:hypothetical protein [Sphingobium lactosutens]EQB16703.1 hypothetical protein RLDS_07770 [Sphingobium lactosutens DS20]